MISATLKNTLLNNYGRYMHVKLFVDENDNQLRDAYVIAVNVHNNKIENHPQMIDAGFDILVPASDILSKSLANKVDFKIVCACKMVTPNNGSYNTGFYMYPRSSISKSPFRLANNVGIIDAGYRGHLIGMFDLPGGNTEHISKFDKYLQICAPGLVPIFVELVDSKEDLGEQTLRGEGGFGSSGSTF
jgi:dUTP pyrophosphatase